jgi:alkylation response protein AidB-like acyl-CoA dehydrogenase
MTSLDLELTQEQVSITESVADVLQEQFPIERISKLAEGAAEIDRSVWSAWAELGWFGLGIPESDGGIGCGIQEEALLFLELGRSLAPGPVLATVLAAKVAVRAGDRQLAEDILSGRLTVGLGLPVDANVRVGATVHGDFTLFDSFDAALLLHRGDAAILRGEHIVATDIVSIDELVRMSDASMDGAATEVAISDAGDIVANGRLLVAAMLAGIAQATLAMSVEYALIREQFGRPIGSFQAVKHRCADMALKAEAAGALIRVSSVEATDSPDVLPARACLARIVATDAALHNSRANIQNHGGIGMTFEHPAHHYVKRADTLAHLLDVGDSPTSLILEAAHQHSDAAVA